MRLACRLSNIEHTGYVEHTGYEWLVLDLTKARVKWLLQLIGFAIGLNRMDHTFRRFSYEADNWFMCCPSIYDGDDDEFLERILEAEETSDWVELPDGWMLTSQGYSHVTAPELHVSGTDVYFSGYPRSNGAGRKFESRSQLTVEALMYYYQLFISVPLPSQPQVAAEVGQHSERIIQLD